MSYSPPSTAKQFTLNVLDDAISEWRQLLQLSKLAPDTWEGRQDDRSWGVPRAWLENAKNEWLNTYDWRAEEARINSFPQYKMQIESADMHFVALFSQRADAIPIVFLHGWPGSFIEFLPLCELIRSQYAPQDQPYHIIVPSLPGYTLGAELPKDRSWTLEDSSRVLNSLMKELGFDKYIAQGGDVGSYLARIMAQKYEACVGIHLNMMTFEEKPEYDTLSPLEQRAMDSAKRWREKGSAYALEHGTKPSTIGAVLSSSPLALLAWIGEKFLDWTDKDPPLTTILTNISLYWFTSSFPSSIYPYRQLHGPDSTKLTYLSKPTGFSFFPLELFPGIKAPLEKNCNLVTYEQHEHGGHFAALECPEELWGDVKKYVEKAWEKAEAKKGARL
jgi:microsomal epoxide hydrolase